MIIDHFNALSSPISEDALLTYTGVRSGAGSAASYRVSEPLAFTVLHQPGRVHSLGGKNVDGRRLGMTG